MNKKASLDMSIGTIIGLALVMIAFVVAYFIYNILADIVGAIAR